MSHDRWQIYDRWLHLITSPGLRRVSKVIFQAMLNCQLYTSRWLASLMSKTLEEDKSRSVLHSLSGLWLAYVALEQSIWHIKMKKEKKKSKQHLLYKVNTDTKCHCKCSFLQCALPYKIYYRSRMQWDKNKIFGRKNQQDNNSTWCRDFFKQTTNTVSCKWGDWSKQCKIMNW